MPRARRDCRRSPTIRASEVDALRRRPGSIRRATPARRDDAQQRKLLAALRGVEPADARRAIAARWCRALPPIPQPMIAQASWEGRIVDAPRGSGGFGYDPIFEVPGSGRDGGRAACAEKNR